MQSSNHLGTIEPGTIVSDFDTYTVAVRCTNCGNRLQGANRVTIPKGVTVEGHLFNKTCPVCGCKTLASMTSLWRR